MDKSQLLQRAQEIATFAHSNQVDLAGKPYIDHPRRVADMLSGSSHKTIAWLHDVIEDNPKYANIIYESFPRHIIYALEVLTRRPGEFYFDYIVRVGNVPTAIDVKIADLVDNMNLTRLSTVTEKDLKRHTKYHEALCYLLSQKL